MLGVDLAPLDFNCGDEVVYVEDSRYAERPRRGTRVDSISYYTQELAADSRHLFKMQQRKSQIAESGNQAIRADNWLDQAVRNFTVVASRIIEDSLVANDLSTPDESFDLSPDALVAEHMTSRYGSFSPATVSPGAWYSEKKGKSAKLMKQERMVRTAFMWTGAAVSCSSLSCHTAHFPFPC